MAQLIRTVVLACAKQRRADLGAVVEVLAGRGNAVEVVSGIEANPLPWEQTVGRIGPNAIYVVCGDDVLTLEKIAGLRATLQRGNVPLANIWAGPINWAEPVQVLRHADQLLRAVNGQMLQPPSEASGRTVLAPPAPRTAPPPVRTMAAPPKPAPTPPPTMEGAAESLVVEGMGNRKPLVFAGIGVALVGVILTAVFWPGDDAPEVVAEASAAKKPEAAVDVAEKKQPEAAVDVAQEEEPEAEVDETPAPAEPAAAQTPEPPEVEVEVEADDVPEPAPEVAVAVDADAPTLSPAPETPRPAGGLGGEDPAVAEALRNQSIRALDILLISPEAKVQKRRKLKVARLRHADAAQHCEDLAVDGVDGWRLPTIGELASLTTANILGHNATYWSDTKGDTYGNTRVIWAVRTRRMISVGANNRGARTICVRDAV